jgi:anionic cell wall polymer biosynthesis LytR-Cps2A-Psr (LCP) family protein
MKNRILLIVTSIVLVLLVLSGLLIYVIISSSSENHPKKTPDLEPTVLMETPEISIPAGKPSNTESVLITIPSDNPESTLIQADQTAIFTEPVSPANIPETPTPTVSEGASFFPPLNVQCNNTGAISFTLIVEDSNTFEPPFGAELIRLVGIDFDKSQVVLIPLSSYIELPTSSLNETYGISKLTLGTIYHTVYQRSANIDQRNSEASLVLNNIIKDNFQTSPDHYISLNQAFLKQFVKFTGAIEIDNPKQFSSLETDYSSGRIQIDTDNIWDYLVYTKNPEGEFSRLERQDILFDALFDAVHTRHSVSELKEWLEKHEADLTTDMEIDQLSGAFCALGFSNKDALLFTQIPSEYFKINPDTITIIEQKTVVDFLDQQSLITH